MTLDGFLIWALYSIIMTIVSGAISLNVGTLILGGILLWLFGGLILGGILLTSIVLIMILGNVLFS